MADDLSPDGFMEGVWAEQGTTPAAIADALPEIRLRPTKQTTSAED
jgi:hypothetical protein